VQKRDGCRGNDGARHGQGEADGWRWKNGLTGGPHLSADERGKDGVGPLGGLN
jgi:hypothetical protein